MTIKKQIVAILTTLGVSASVYSVAGLQEECIFDKVVLHVADEQLCFKEQADYEAYRDDLIGIYNAQDPLMLWTGDGQQFFAVLQYEMSKLGGISIKNPDSDTDFISEMVSRIP